MNSEDLQAAESGERLGDAAGIRQTAAAHYREAQRLLLPPGFVWTDRAEYDSRLEAFERIQQKLYALENDRPLPPPAEPERAQAEPPEPAPELSVWQFTAGLVVRVRRDFTDYDGQVIRADEILHFQDSSYFPYDSGHTLHFAEKTIRLAGLVEEHEPIIANHGNSWFEVLRGRPD